MRLSIRSRFAVTAMIDVGLREGLGPVPLNDIALRHHISLSCLEQLFCKLRQRGLVTSTRGPGGGYTLGGRMDGITVADILCAFEEAPSEAKLPDVSPAIDMTQDLWDAVNTTVLHFTQSVTLKSLVLDQMAKGVTIEKKTCPNRGVFQRPIQQSVGPDVPNSVFAQCRTSRTLD